MKQLKCPNCSYTQEHPSLECPRCGIVFAKFHARLTGSPSAPPPAPGRDPFSRFGWIRPTIRAARWFFLIVSVMSLYLILSPSPAPVIAVRPEARESAERKIAQFERSVRAGRSRQLSLDESELNAWLGTNLEFSPEASRPEKRVSAGLPTQAADLPEGLSTAEVESIRSSVTDLKVALVGERIRTHLRFELYGKEMSFELEGRLSTRDGYLCLEPTAGKLGSLPIPSMSLSAASSRLLESPENREKFRLPDYISDITIRGGELLVEYAGR